MQVIIKYIYCSWPVSGLKHGKKKLIISAKKEEWAKIFSFSLTYHTLMAFDLSKAPKGTSSTNQRNIHCKPWSLP